MLFCNQLVYASGWTYVVGFVALLGIVVVVEGVASRAATFGEMEDTGEEGLLVEGASEKS